jgi:hypothetical protein
MEHDAARSAVSSEDTLVDDEPDSWTPNSLVLRGTRKQQRDILVDWIGKLLAWDFGGGDPTVLMAESWVLKGELTGNMKAVPFANEIMPSLASLPAKGAARRPTAPAPAEGAGEAAEVVVGDKRGRQGGGVGAEAPAKRRRPSGQAALKTQEAADPAQEVAAAKAATTAAAKAAYEAALSSESEAAASKTPESGASQAVASSAARKRPRGGR